MTQQTTTHYHIVTRHPSAHREESSPIMSHTDALNEHAAAVRHLQRDEGYVLLPHGSHAGFNTVTLRSPDKREVRVFIDRCKRACSGIALALCLAVTAPAGCSITHGWDDGSRIATCSDGSKVIAYDPDGQVHPGFPYRAPGTWHGISH